MRLSSWPIQLILACSLAGCPAQQAQDDKGEPEKPRPAATAPKQAEPEPAAPAVDPALVALDPGGAPTLARFKSVYLAEEAISTDESFLAELHKLTDPDQAKGVFETLKGRDDVLPPLRKAMWHRDPNTRSNVARILVLLDDHAPETRNALVDVVLHDADGDVRSNVARALVTYADKETVTPLITVLASDPRLTARENAAWALGQIGDRRAVKPLVSALDDPETRVRLRAVSALKRLKAKEAIKDLVERVQDPNMVVRERAVQTLQELTGKKIGEDYAKWKKAVGR